MTIEEFQKLVVEMRKQFPEVPLMELIGYHRLSTYCWNCRHEGDTYFKQGEFVSLKNMHCFKCKMKKKDSLKLARKV